jgi:hypothetical protein
MSDYEQVARMLELAADANTLQAVEQTAARKILAFDGEKFPADSCAITQSCLMQSAGLDVPDTYQALAFGNMLKKRGWQVVPVGKQAQGDMGSTCGAVADHGNDHVYFVLYIVNADEMVIADNQASAPHFRFASGKGGKTPTKFFLRAAPPVSEGLAQPALLTPHGNALAAISERIRELDQFIRNMLIRLAHTNTETC